MGGTLNFLFEYNDYIDNIYNFSDEMGAYMVLEIY